MTSASGKKTDFDSASHQALHSMIADADPAQLMAKGTLLSEAAQEIGAIADELKARVDSVRWEGDGGESFRRWGHHMAKESRKLATYTATAGYWLNQSGEALAEAQRMPTPNFVESADAVADAARNNPLGLTDPGHQEAIRQLTKVASYYTVAQEYISQQEKPNFKPPSGFTEVLGGNDEQQRPYHPVVDARRGASEVGSADALANRSSDDLPPSSTSRSTNTGTPSGDVHTASDRDVRIVTNAAALPSEAQLPSPSPGAPSAGQASTAPPHGSGTVPVVANPVGRPRGNSPGTPVGQTPVADNRRSPHAPVTGRPPLGQGDGIIGGTPQPRSTAVPRPQQGMVMGEERGPMTRGPVGAAGGPGSGAIPATPGTPGRRGVPEPSSPVRGNPRAPGRAPSEFTPGGTGLVRGSGQHPGMAPHPGAPTPSPNRRGTGQRPDYLEEDEETWTNRRRDIIPPVIE